MVLQYYKKSGESETANGNSTDSPLVYLHRMSIDLNSSLVTPGAGCFRGILVRAKFLVCFAHECFAKRDR